MGKRPEKNFVMLDNRLKFKSQSFWKWAEILFLLSVWYAAFVDLPIALERLLSVKNSFYIPNLFRSASWFASLEQLYDFIYILNHTNRIPWHKLAKDVFLLSAIVCVMVVGLRKRWFVTALNSRSLILIAYINLLVLIGVLFVISVLRNDIWVATIGLRTHISLLVFFFGIFITKDRLHNLWKWLRPILFIQIGFATLQRWMHVQRLWPVEMQRSTGTFFEVNTFGIFLAACLIFIFFLEMNVLARWSYFGVTLILIILTRSRSAIFLALLIILVYAWSNLRHSYQRKVVIAALLFFVPLVPSALWVITKRPNVIQDFLAIRGVGPLNYLLSIHPIEAFIGKGLGLGTTLIYRITNSPDIQISDSFDNLVGSVLVQGGLLFLLFTLTFIVSPLRQSQRGFLDIVVPLFSLCASVMIPLWEAWPANLMVLILFGYIAGYQNTYRIDSPKSLNFGG